MKEKALIYDARGNGDGKTCCSIVGGHQSSISDYTAIVIENYPSDSRLKIRKDGICQTLRSRMGTGGGNVPMGLQINGTGRKESD